MLKYILKRILLMIPTFLGATLLTFAILTLVPGGPLERAITQMNQAAGGGGGSGDGAGGSSGQNKISPEIIEQLRQQYGLDKPFLTRYLTWLGLAPRETKSKTVSVGDTFRENLERVEIGNKRFLKQRWIKVVKEGDKIVTQKSGVGGDYAFGKYPELPPVSAINKWSTTNDWDINEEKDGKIKLRQTAFSGILTGDFGESYEYGKPVLTLIRERLYISVYFGFIGFFLTYLVCIPLGIFKAVKHNSKFDFFTSGIIFMGYAVPGYALGVLLLVMFGGGAFMGLELFPLGGFRSPDFEELSFFGKIWDQLHHTFLPVISYMVSAFATLTLLMKNSLMDNLSQDYVRTGFAKGLPENKVVFVHAVRNSLIPIATGLGRIVGIFLAGSYLIELIFNIDGIGLLSFKSVVNSDYPVFLGFLVINILVLMVGNLLSDMLYVLIDPRIKFD